ncbi:Caltractin [Botryosphaeria dothidea]|uniref:Caltractin n=1 Tax=Botryosphaeria dothidea TaxID=55169 RepID=A0A8H4IVM7_9PEZI|nr:Caltractin [Botryosphaeria dothidea]
MPSKRANKKSAAPASSSKAAAPKAARRSALARENDLTAAQETAIRDAFALFATKRPDTHPNTLVVKTSDCRRILTALGFALTRNDVREMSGVLDPETEGWVAYEHFVAYAGVWFHAQGGEGEAEVGREGIGRADMEKAYFMFTGGRRGPITVRDLRRVAKELREEVDEALLWDMVAEANGEARTKEGVGRGVDLEEFEGVMKRAGVFG